MLSSLLRKHQGRGMKQLFNRQALRRKALFVGVAEPTGVQFHPFIINRTVSVYVFGLHITFCKGYRLFPNFFWIEGKLFRVDGPL